MKEEKKFYKIIYQRTVMKQITACNFQKYVEWQKWIYFWPELYLNKQKLLCSDEKEESRTEKMLRAAEKRVQDLRQELAKKMAEMIEEDDEILRKKKNEIEKLQQQLENEERSCAEIEEELAYDQQCEAEIIEAEEKLKESKIALSIHH